MTLRLEDKKALVAEVNEVASTALSAIAALYRGMTVAQLTDLRAKARSEGVYVRVVKNTLAKRAIDGTEFECLADSLTGPIILAFSREDPGAAARLVKEFAKTCENLVTQAVAIGGQAYPASDLDRLASSVARSVAGAGWQIRSDYCRASGQICTAARSLSGPAAGGLASRVHQSIR
jgi:large subunit ribosomal protein L10